MKNLIVLIFLLSFFACTEKHKQKNNINNGIACSETTILQQINPKVEKPNCITKIVLREMGIDVFPYWVYQYPNIESMDLSFNTITNLPNDIGKLKNIKSLNISHSYLKSLPNEIGKWKDLKSATLIFNELQYLPQGICDCENLMSLNLTGNNIKKLPYCLSNLKKLKSIGISDENGKCQLDSIELAKMKVAMPWCSFSPF